ncbi:TRAP transporter substrate-binding protein DctP [Cohaesibacter celericrescens]|uniref:C4-dicarboxylate ABC transporter substrate-binding protein n=1 Tax=Cohaesibacter celericrescens TaxID=2067669 RepID=A0A2N5XRX8_9HYPH|nr:TRAP transporter substrate-binding protein DctP [Cohaesibacter celericrescens]PLW77276.1 C4-dicarboxylate ABC transporter substrate-binding protein [Cohaesibacter celericrescens]
MKVSRKILSLACVLAVMSTGAMAKTYKIATNVQEKSTAGEMISEFAKSVAEKTDGRVKFKVFSNGVLGDQLDYFQQIQKGVVDVGLVNSAALENVIPAYGVVNLPYVFRSSEEYGKVMADAGVRAALFDAAAKHNFAPLGFLSSGFRSLYVTTPINSVADIKGKKLRTMSSETYIDMLSRFGAVPTPLSFGELYSAMQQGVVDGAEGGLAGLWSAKFGEVAKYALKTEQTRLTDFVVTSLEFQKSVSAEDLETINEIFAEISKRSIEWADASEARDLKLAVDKMGVTVVEIDKGPLMESVVPMYKDAMKDADKAALLGAIFKIEGRTFD